MNFLRLVSNSVGHIKPVVFIQIDVLFLIKTKSKKLTCRPGVPGRPGGPTLPYEKTKIYKNQIIDAEAYLDPSPTSTMEFFFLKIVNGF